MQLLQNYKIVGLALCLFIVVMLITQYYSVTDEGFDINSFSPVDRKIILSARVIDELMRPGPAKNKIIGVKLIETIPTYKIGLDPKILNDTTITDDAKVVKIIDSIIKPTLVGLLNMKNIPGQLDNISNAAVLIDKLTRENIKVTSVNLIALNEVIKTPIDNKQPPLTPEQRPALLNKVKQDLLNILNKSSRKSNHNHQPQYSHIPGKEKKILK